jgi:hypothetical protein
VFGRNGEFLSVFIMQSLYRLGASAQWVFVCFSLVHATLLHLIISRLTKSGLNYGLCVFLLLTATSLYFNQLNQLRQFASFYAAFLAILSLIDKRFALHIVYGLIAVGFHAVGFAYITVFYLSLFLVNRFELRWLIIIGILGIFILNFVARDAISIFLPNYAHYLDREVSLNLVSIWTKGYYILVASIFLFLVPFKTFYQYFSSDPVLEFAVKTWFLTMFVFLIPLATGIKDTSRFVAAFTILIIPIYGFLVSYFMKTDKKIDLLILLCSLLTPLCLKLTVFAEREYRYQFIGIF